MRLTLVPARLGFSAQKLICVPSGSLGGIPKAVASRFLTIPSHMFLSGGGKLWTSPEPSRDCFAHLDYRLVLAGGSDW